MLFLAVTLLLIGVIIVAAAVIQENHELTLEEEEYELLSAELKVSEEEPESEMLPEEATPAFSAESEPPEDPEESETTDDPDETEELTEVYLVPEEESAEEAEDEPQQGDNPQEYSPGRTNPGSPSSPTQQAQTGYTGANLSACKKKNSEFIAWLKIPGTKVDYPVVLTDRVDYYLDHNFNRKQSKLGTLFSLAKTDYETPGRNIAIYGHHMKATKRKGFLLIIIVLVVLVAAAVYFFQFNQFLAHIFEALLLVACFIGGLMFLSLCIIPFYSPVLLFFLKLTLFDFNIVTPLSICIILA